MSCIINKETAFAAGGKFVRGYLALPEGESGPGVIVLHSWWGLTPFFRQVCDRLAAEGIAAFAPDLNGGRVAGSIAEAEELLGQRDYAHTQAVVAASVRQLRPPAASVGGGLGVLGFSMGASWALTLASLAPHDIAAGVVFYGVEGVDFSQVRAPFQGHFGLEDESVSPEWARQMEADMQGVGLETDFYFYPGAGHWFFEEDRPPHFNRPAAELAWGRTVAYLKKHL